MNIFYLHKNPKICAQYHCDKHVVKMIVETAQILSTVHWVCGDQGPYKATHQKHPCVIWAGESKNNYKWLHSLGIELCKEYTYRYQKTHGSEKILRQLSKPPRIKSLKLTKRPQTMPEQYRGLNTITAYRKFYIGEKTRFAKWKNRKIPSWFLKMTLSGEWAKNSFLLNKYK